MRKTALALAAVAMLAACSSSPATTYKAHVTNRAVINPADLAVTIQVTNTGKAAGTPECTIQADDPAGSYHGTDIITLRHQLQPGKTVTGVANVTVTNHGAGYITSATVTCDEAS